MREPDLLRIAASGRLARLAGRGPPDDSGKRWRSMHATAMTPGKRGESPNADGHRAAWCIRSCRSAGASHDGTQPRVKVCAGAGRQACDRRDGQGPGAPHIQQGGRDTDGDVAMARRIRSKDSPLWTGPDRTRDHAPPEKPEDHDKPRSPVTSPERRDHDANRDAPQAARGEVA